MRTRLARAGTALVFTGGLLAGCQSAARRSAYDDNPLLQTRQPLVQTPVGSNRLTQIAQARPNAAVPPPGATGYAPPAVPTAPAGVAPDQPSAYAAAVPTYTPPPTDAGPALPDTVATAAPAPLPARVTAPEPAAPVPPPGPAPVPAVVMAAQAGPAPVTPAVARRVEGKYGSAGDYTWLQGELDRHYRGYIDLRYRPASEEDAFGGKVRLENDPRLAEFRAGDVVAVEGELVRDPEAEAQPWGQYPHYHIRSIHLVERK